MAQSPEELQRRLAALEEENKRLKQKPAEPAKLVSGYMVTTNVSTYNGKTHGIQFRDGKAFIPDMPDLDAKKVAQRIRDDFGYKVDYVENIHDMSKLNQEIVKANFLDVLSVPQILGRP